MTQLLENSLTWFKFDAWFVAFWGALAVIAALEILIPAFKRPAQRLDRWPTNFGLGVINSAVMPLVPVSIVWAAQWANSNNVGLLNQIAHPSLWIAVAVTLVIRSLAGYLVHVLMHKVPLFWRLHRVHHLDTHLDVSTSLRSHPAEPVVNLAIMLPVAVIFGMTPWVLIIYELVDAIVNAFSHANLRMPHGLDRRVRWVFVTPNMHCIHHSSYQPETDSNYGQVFAFWDRMFGTYRPAPAQGYDELQIGLAEIRDQRASDIWWQLKSPAINIPAGPVPPNDRDFIRNHANR